MEMLILLSKISLLLGQLSRTVTSLVVNITLLYRLGLYLHLQ